VTAFVCDVVWNGTVTMGTKVGGYFRRRNVEVFRIEFSWSMRRGGWQQRETEMKEEAASQWLYNHIDV
jgi:hypothetical protein